MSEYDFNFYKNRDESTRYSARAVLSLVLDAVPSIRSAVDVGCGVGTWLAVLQEKGVADIQGIDGPWVQRELLQIPADKFISQNLSDPIQLRRRFDLAISLEVAEHLPEGRADAFVKTLVDLSDVVLFSAAIPGQGGTSHVNEQWQNYWAQKFTSHGYKVNDLIRPHLWNDERVPVWYRQNTLLFTQERIAVSPKSTDAGGSRSTLNLVHPNQFRAKDMDRLGVRGAFALLLRALARYVRAK